jgi:polyketide synthase PksN
MMIDFIEYIVAELKSRRLSKANAVGLVRQFSVRSSGPAAAVAIHPLLHNNTSDLNGQRYRSIFTGEEFFLADHQVTANAETSHKVLPGVAYLEMVRAAISDAVPEQRASMMPELHNIIWAQPIVVSGTKQVGIALSANEADGIDFEIYTGEAEEEIVHCQGHAVFHSRPARPSLDIAKLQAEMTQGVLPAEAVYATCARMGLAYGPAFRSLTAIHRGNGQVLARLRLPEVVADKAGDYFIHPSLMDGALQAAVGLIESGSEPLQARLPFALETLRLLSPCTPEMFAWVRYASGSGPSDKLVKLDADLCDAEGAVCVQVRGLSSRALSTEIRTPAAERDRTGSLFAVPAWKPSSIESFTPETDTEYAVHHVIACELAEIDAGTLASLFPDSQCLVLQKGEGDIAQRYSDHALACFELVQALLQGRPRGKTLVQIVVANHEEQVLFAGLSSLLKTATLENPLLSGQLVVVAPEITSSDLATCLETEKRRGRDALIKYEDGTRYVSVWQEVPVGGDTATVAFKDSGIYLLTGGLGGLGVLFAEEILSQASGARVVLAGRSSLSEGKQAVLDGLSSKGRVIYRQADVGDPEQVRQLIASIVDEHGRLDGILHIAGLIADDFILKKNAGDFRAVLMPKVTGTVNLDQASRDLDLDFFVLFSSLTGVAGNPGQADYAVANGFMDQFATYRNRQVAAKQRHGRTKSINWPLWEAGGMGVDPATREMLQQNTGGQPMRTATGIKAFYGILAAPYDQMLVMEGDLARIRRALLAGPAASPSAAAVLPAAAAVAAPENLAEKTEEYLRKELSELLKVPSHRIDARAALENYGIDSMLAMKLTNQLEKTFGSLPKTLFFEYQTIRELADYFTEHHAPRLTALLTPTAPRAANAVPAVAPEVSSVSTKLVSGLRSSRRRSAAPVAKPDAGPIAIIGLSGRYPEAVNIEAYWDNLRDGKDCITEVPRERWDWREYYNTDRTAAGHHYSKWGGFIEGVDEFDPLFFNMSPFEAEIVDPQERLFLQHAWMAVEDAGYTRASMQVPDTDDLPGQVGVYVGLMWVDYPLFGAEAQARGRRLGIVGSPSSIANRVSYVLNLHGPSMTLDTMCSSSLTAIHAACQDLKHGRTSMAIAGGVNVTIHPNKYLVLSAGQFISSDGHCQSFGEGGDGYIPGEGVGVVVLKRLSEAKRDGDHIYGIIRGSALNHGGKTNGYSVPNPQAQAGVIRRALAESEVNARHISYLEAHGTGTKLGDPIEIAALSKAFRRYTEDTEFCRIGSAKSNIGHCESAAGIAGLTKVLLQMQHQQIAPSLHSAELNPNIDFPESPFIVNQSLKAWEQPIVDGHRQPRIAGISSFGAGGSNAHMIVEEYPQPVFQAAAFTEVVVVLSARTPERLQQKAGDLLDFVRRRHDSIDLACLAYTLQTGREAMEQRLGFVVSSAAQLVETLQSHVSGQQGVGEVVQGEVKRHDEGLSLFANDADLQQTIDKWIANKKFSKLLELWVKGLDVDWSRLYSEVRPQRISLPAYPFAKERYWIDVTAAPLVAAGAASAVLHPLLHRNTSDLSEQRYRSDFTGDEFFLTDHQVRTDEHTTQKVLPAVAYLEMARAAVEQAMPARPESAVLELHHTGWAQPIVVTQNTQVNIALTSDDNRIDYEIYSGDGDHATVHCQGSAMFNIQSPPAALDVEQLRARMDRGALDAESIYGECARMGLVYGAAFQGITAVHRGNGEVLAQLRLPAVVYGAASYVLHPSLMDSALQAAVGLIQTGLAIGQPRVPFALETLRIVSPCTPEMVAWVRYAPGSQASGDIVKLDVDLCDAQGNVCVQMRGFSLRALSSQVRTAKGGLLAFPVWQTVSAAVGRIAFAEHHVILCELPNVDATRLSALVPGSQCVSLPRADHKNIAERYSEHAVACFERIRAILRGQSEGKVLVQIIIPGNEEQAVLAGLSGLLKTAGLENPRLIGQLILVSTGVAAEDLARYLEAEKSSGAEALISYRESARQVMRWQEAESDAETPAPAFKDHGVYLITGGLGGLGLLFAKEILGHAEARVVLTGRAALSTENQRLLDGLSADGRVRYEQVDLGDLHQVEQLIAGIVGEHGRLNAILHSAGMIADNFILRKTDAEFAQVLAPKVTGTVHLDVASAHVALDFFALFSSLTGAMGNPGQSDYAAANGFMDQFAAYRNLQVAAGRRHGRTRSINWPLWQAGGMSIDPAAGELMEQTTGLQPMQTARGMRAFERSLELPHDQLLVAEGDLARIRRALFAVPSTPYEPEAEPLLPAAGIDPADLTARTQDYLRKEFSEILKLPAYKIDPRAPLENYGIDSILAMRLTSQLEKVFGSLSKTLFFEYQTIAALATYFAKAHRATLREKLGLLYQQPKVQDAGRTSAAPRLAVAPHRKNRFIGAGAKPRTEIAIVGLAGRYPQAGTLQEFWKNLQEGRDSITEIPLERWDHARYFDPGQNKLGKTYSKWGGFLGDVDKFDPLLFHISPKEAALLDPQERLFLETAWETIEDAGYTRQNISGGRVGVYVGVMWGQYELFGAESLLRGGTAVPVSSYASIANRVSYFFDLHGPSIALDTMCSSSLTAIHLACDELRKGEIDAALAGGVNVTVHPYKYITLSQGQFMASDGRCRAFGAGGDGYVPGEGVGAVLLKRLDDALRDGDQIYAVIKSSTVNHGGKTNGYSVPNPTAQGDLILDAVRKAGIDPKTLGYLEAHGTGTALGDPIEIAGLARAFEGSGAEKQFCPIGSVKSNIGHLESAAGIAAVTKVLLQIRHQKLVPSLHADPLNPNINFAESPFYVQTGLTEWKRGAYPRRAGVSSFGAGGANAHLILEEYADAREPAGASQAPEFFVLSARDADALRRYAERMAAFLDTTAAVSLADVAYTSQVGRTPMDARLAVIARSVDDLRDRLNAWIALRNSGDVESEPEHVFYGNVKDTLSSAAGLIEGQAGQRFLHDLLAGGELEKIARLWTLGAGVDWSLMERRGKPRKVSLPTYPFARERCWIPQGSPSLAIAKSAAVPAEVPAPAPAEEKQRTYYSVRWTPQPLAAAAPERAAVGPILILDASDQLFLAMKERQEDGPVIWVKPGETFEEVGPAIYSIEWRQEDQFRHLLAHLEQKELFPAVVVHHSPDPCNLEVSEEVAQQLDRGLYSLFALCKALVNESRQVPPKIISVFSSSESEATAPLASAIGGFLRTLTLENPKYLAKTIDIRDGGALSLAEKISLLGDEIRDPDWMTKEILYRPAEGEGKQALTRSIRTLLPQHMPARDARTSLPLKRNGVYLITGGLGGLGLIFAEYLAKNYQAKLILTGRSAPGPGRDEKLGELASHGAEVLRLQADVSKREDMEMVVREAKARFSQIDGVLHAAGVNRDAFILRKTREEMEAVLAPKVYGALNTDFATRDENLDFFVLFSSVAGVMGNVGQSDYAYANHFLDSFAERRESLRKMQQRSGRTLSIDWPLWAEGGMGIPPDAVALLERRTGTSPLPARDGIQYWEDFLCSDVVQGVALYGIASRIAAYVSQVPAQPRRAPLTAAEGMDSTALLAKTEAYLKALIGKEIALEPERIDSTERLESFGIDSVVINHINAQLEQDLGELPKTLLYERETIREVAKFLTQESREALLALFSSSDAPPLTPPSHEEPVIVREEILPAEHRGDIEEIAIIGINVSYPHSTGLAEYWDNLKHGRELIDLVPFDRWDYEEFYHPDPAAAADGKIYCKWGGFLSDADKFDPHFFKIPTAEAGMIDPQERLFLESAWSAIEDAGYTRDTLRARFPKAGSADVGVYVGVTTNSYHLLGPGEWSRGNYVSPGAMPWSIANRVSYFFDFNGPSLPVDTACSSSLVAIHLACESLRKRECQVALAGGVNLYLHPSKYQGLCQRRSLSADGKCHSYGSGDEGFVPGEGVGTLVLKPLQRAIEDNDRIYAVIRASAFDHSGRSNGYSAPNPNAQASLISRTLEGARIDPESIGYVEGHGTGTQMGDSLEIAALTQAFQKSTAKRQFCPIGSVKANLGHSESAAGIASVAKVVLQLTHRQLAPSINSDEPNPNIEFEKTPFYLQHALSDWPSPPGQPRRALVNAFGAGGVNACVVVEEYRQPEAPAPSEETGPRLFVLSARNEDRLRDYADRVLDFLRHEPGTDLTRLCYTFQAGREPMEERLAAVVSDIDDLMARLADWSARRSPAGVQRGSLGPRRGSRRFAKLVKISGGEESLAELAAKWVTGEDVDWDNLYSRPPQRMAVPTYPFARERYWVSDSPVAEKQELSVGRPHPLIAYNSSTLREVSFHSSLSDTAFYAVDHRVRDERIFPGAGFLELACISANIASEQKVRRIEDIVWIQPLSFRTGPQTLRTVLRHKGEAVRYEISSFNDENEAVVHSEGRVTFANGSPEHGEADERIAIHDLKKQCAAPLDRVAYYETIRTYGLQYGPSFQTIQELYVNGSFSLSKLKIAEYLKGDFSQFILHPSIIDGALQTVGGLMRSGDAPVPYLPFALDEIDLIRPVVPTCYAYVERADESQRNRSGVMKFNIRILNESGDVLVKMNNLCVRPLPVPQVGSQAPAAAAGGRQLLRLSGESAE